MSTAPGHPGMPHVWTSGAKDFVTSSLGPGRVWATIGQGILNEVYWPSTGQPQIKDMGFLAVGKGAFFEAKKSLKYTVTTPEPCMPLPVISHTENDYRLEIEVLPDPLRDVLLVRYRFEDLLQADLKGRPASAAG
jgi:glucoamylase